MRRLWFIGVLVSLAVHTLLAQAPVSITALWDLGDPTHADPAITWQLEIDGIEQPCLSPIVTATERRCQGSTTAGLHTFRLRGVHPASGAGSWSVLLSQTVSGPSTGAPGPSVITFVFAEAAVPPPPGGSMATFGPVVPSEIGDNGWENGGSWQAGFAFIGNNGSVIHTGFRWQNVTIPAGSTITSATLHIRARNAVSGTITNIHTKLGGHKGDAPQWQEGVFEPSSITPATAVDWDPTVWVPDDYYDLDFTAVVQEIVNGTWVSGYDLALVITDDGSTSSNSARMESSIDGNPAANGLTIVYTEPSAGGGIVRQMLQHHRGRQPSFAWRRRDSGLLARAA